MKVVADTAPLVAAANARDRAHRVAAALVHRLGRDLLVPVPVLTEADYMIRTRVGADAARLFLAAVAAGTYSVAFLTQGLLRRVAEIDSAHADLGLGIVDASVMAVAERHELPILTFDFADFRAAPSPDGPWPLVVSESQLAGALES